MDIFHTRPLAQLAPCIDRLWGWESAAGETVRLPTLLPGTGAELYFHYREPFRYPSGEDAATACPPGHLFCVRRRPIHLLPSNGVGFIAVRFKVGMIHRFTDLPATEFLDRVLPLEDLWGTAGAAILRHLSYAGSRAEKLALIQDFLIRQLRSSPPDPVVETAMSALYRQSPGISVEGLAAGLHLSRRQLERRFFRLAGQTPSEVRCLSRFQRTVRQLLLDGSADPTDRALANGYFDQAHFIRDFRRLAGATPRQHLAEARAKSHFYNTSLSPAGMLRTPIPLR